MKRVNVISLALPMVVIAIVLVNLYLSVIGL